MGFAGRPVSGDDGFKPAVSVEQGPLAVGVEQGPCLVLAMDVDQSRTEPPQHRHRHRQAVGVRNASAVRTDPTGDDQQVVLDRAAEDGLDLVAEFGVGRQVEDGRGPRLGLAGADQFGSTPCRRAPGPGPSAGGSCPPRSHRSRRNSPRAARPEHPRSTPGSAPTIRGARRATSGSPSTRNLVLAEPRRAITRVDVARLPDRVPCGRRRKSSRFLPARRIRRGLHRDKARSEPFDTPCGQSDTSSASEGLPR